MHAARFNYLTVLSVVSVALLGAIACDNTVAPKAAPPAALTIVSGNSQPGALVTTKLPDPLVVNVTDAQNQGVPGIKVVWSTTSGFLTAETSTTDRNGEARVQWTVGTVSGFQTAVAKVTGLSGVTFTQRVLAGPLAQIILSRDTVRLLSIGDSFRFNARPSDQYGNLVAGGSIVESADTSIVSATNFGNGATLIAHAADAHTTLRITAGSLTTSASVVVMQPPCAAGTKTFTLAAGEIVKLAGPDAGDFCLQGGANEEDFVAIPFYSDQTGTLLRVALSAGNTTTSVAAAPSVSLQRNVARRPRVPERDDQFDVSLRERSRVELTPLINSARLIGQERGYRLNTGTAPLQVGTLIPLNVNALSGCNNPTIKTGRVAAISDRAIVVADTANPADGFSAEDYRYFGAAFDTLVYPVDVSNFGEPSDIDGNQRVILFFTRSVNELTPPNQNFYVGGFFYSRDLFPREMSTSGIEACAGSNQAEMFYLLVPDPKGTVNSNERSLDFVRTSTIGTLAHEFQHLINSSRRLYVNTGANGFEDTFLDEGLAHIAEELAFYRSSGLSPRQNISAATIASSQNVSDAFNSFGVANIRRFRQYLNDPLDNSPYASNSNLTTRGATWSFLRFAADHRSGDERDMWFKLVNATAPDQHGVANLIRVLGPDFTSLLRDWAVANYADDFVSGIDASIQHPSWNYRSILDGLDSEPFPLAVQRLDSSAVSLVGIVDGAPAYLRFGVATGAKGGARITTRGGSPVNGFFLSVLRTR